MAYYSIRDNHNHGSVGDYLKEAITDNSRLSVVSAYFTIYAYQKLKDELNNIDNLRFLFGEPTFIKSLDPEKKNVRNYKIEDDQLIIPIENRLNQKAIALKCSNWIRDKVDIRSMVKPNFLHGKLYHIRQASSVEKAIAGSSNFTVSGLGLGGSNNIELNVVIDSDRDRKELKEWFDNLWNDDTGLVEDVKEEVLKYLAQLYTNSDPEFIYFKTLYHIFENYLDDQQRGGLLDEKTGFFDSEIWNTLYEFQKDGVKGAINKILKHNGCIIADSVGLGKTFEALAVIKYFELLNARVLVICPKRISNNWTIYQAVQNNAYNPFSKDRFNYSVVYHTDLGRTSGRSDANSIDLEHFNWGAFDLIVIDESHNFKANPVERKDGEGNVKMNRAQWLVKKIIKSGVKTRVLMLSATPVNNTLRDLRNQISFITEENDNALYESSGIKDIALTLKNAQTQFTQWADRRNKDKNLRHLLDRLDSSFFKLLDELTIARSRKHIKSFYKLDEIGSFPIRLKPVSIYADIDLDDRFLSYDKLNDLILQYKLSIFNPSAYVKEDKKEKYEKLAGTDLQVFKQAERENFLIGMMKVNFLKRLESSIESFEISLDRTISKIEALEQKIKHFINEKGITQEETFESFEPDEDEFEENSEDNEQWQVGKKLKFDLADLHLEEWLEDLKKDKEALIDLHNNAKVVTPERDAKLAELKKIIKTKAYDQPINKGNRKLLLFTAFADTASYLYDNLKDMVQKELGLNIALVLGTSSKTTYGKNDYDSILTNFSPLSKRRDQFSSNEPENEIDILIATDCISEGQNLQDCDYLVNYDIHWNPVRIIQRFGRIDRLGSVNEKIQLINFWATKDLDRYINLKGRVEARMALVDVTATGEDNLLSSEQIENLISDDLKYRNQQLLRLKDEVLDLEDMDETVSLTDFTLDDFRVELLNYITENREKLQNSPYGLYAVIPSPSCELTTSNNEVSFTDSQKDIIKPGVIFCLKQKGNTEGNEQVNPLQPYFLVYIRDDGTVRFNYTSPKQILEIARLMCSDCKKPHEKLCDLFDTETNNGENMEKYADLLRKAVNEIIQIFSKRSIQKLKYDRSALITSIDKQISDIDNFELITWMVIR